MFRLCEEIKGGNGVDMTAVTLAKRRTKFAILVVISVKINY